MAVRHQVRVGGDVGRARGGRDAPRVGSDGGRRARGETAAARERAPHGGERERRHGRHRASRSEMRVTPHVCFGGKKRQPRDPLAFGKKKSETLLGCPPWGVRCPRWRFFFGFRVVSLGGKPRHGRVRVRASFQHARVGPVVAAPPTRREAHPSHSPSQRRARSRPTSAVAHAHLPLTVHRTSETFRRYVNFMSSHASMSLPAPTRVGAAARAARRVALARYVSVTPSLLVRRARTRARPRPAGAVPARVSEPCSKAATPTGLQVAGAKKIFAKSSNRRFFFPVPRTRDSPPLPPSLPPRSQAERASGSRLGGRAPRARRGADDLAPRGRRACLQASPFRRRARRGGGQRDPQRRLRRPRRERFARI